MLLERLCTIVLAAVALAFASHPSFAQKKYDTGASNSEIKIGNIMPYSRACRAD